MSKFGNINITLGERVSRIYTDLRLGIPVIIRAEDEHLVVPVETLNQKRFDLFRSGDKRRNPRADGRYIGARCFSFSRWC